MGDIMDDPQPWLVTIQTQHKWVAAHALQVRDATRDLYSQLVESEAAVARSHALLDKLNARKPCRFP